jgi:hypothetical protein
VEREPKQSDDDVILRFCLDGVIFSLKQNMMTQEEAYENLKKWFPDVEIVPDGEWHEAR